MKKTASLGKEILEVTETFSFTEFKKEIKNFKDIRLKTKTGKETWNKLYLKLERKALNDLLRVDLERKALNDLLRVDLGDRTITAKYWERDGGVDYSVIWIEKISVKSEK